MTRTTIGSVLLLSIGLTAANVRAEAPETRSRIVHYADLNLADPEGQARFSQRIAAAVKDVCGTSGIQPLSYRLAQHRCRAEALGKASEKMAMVVDGARQLALRGGGGGVASR